MSNRPIIVGTRGSALALAQASLVLAQCRAAFPTMAFELKIIKTTGDKLQNASLAKLDASLPKGLFTKELEVALLNGQADLAVHSLKDLPTELPAALLLAATPERADVRDVLIYRSVDKSAAPNAFRGFKPLAALADFPKGATIATSSTRRKAQLLAIRPELKIVEIRGNVATRLKKVADQSELDATVLALAGMTRLGIHIAPDGKLLGAAVPHGLLATVFDVHAMLPCVGQAAIGIEIRSADQHIARICKQLNHFPTFQCVTAERAFLHGMGGGCQSPVAAYAEIVGREIFLRAVSFRDGPAKRREGKGPIRAAAELGEQLAAGLR